MNRPVPASSNCVRSLAFLLSLAILAAPAFAFDGAPFGNPPQLGTVWLGATGTLKLQANTTGSITSLRLVSGTLPPGMELLFGNRLPAEPVFHPNEAVLFGTPTQEGTYEFTVGVTLGASSSEQQQTFDVTVIPLRVSNSGNLPRAIAGEAYSYTFFPTATGVTITPDSNPQFQWPEWLSVDSNNTLKGTPPTSVPQGGYNLRLAATGAAGTIYFGAHLDIDFIKTSVLTATVNQEFNTTLQAVWPNPIWMGTWTPPGLQFDPSTGKISGTPTQPGTYNLNVSASDGAGSFSGKQITLTVVGNPPQPLTIDPWPQRDFSLGEGAWETLRARGGVPPYKWSVVGELPAGMILEPPDAASPSQTLDAMIKGFATQSGSYQFTIQVQDSAPTPATVTRTFSGKVSPIQAVVPFFQPQGTPMAFMGASYSYLLAQAEPGATPSFTFKLDSGSLPDGISLNETTGELRGTPTETGNFWPVVKIDDGSGNTMLRRSYGVFVSSAPVGNFKETVCLNGNSDLGTVTQGQHVEFRFQTGCGGSGPFTYSGISLPNWLTVSADPNDPGGNTVLLSGNAPTGTEGKFTFWIQATDSNNVIGARKFSLGLSSIQIGWTQGVPLDGSVTAGYSLPLTITGGAGPYTFTTVGLPPGLELKDGVLQGTPAAPGNYNATITVEGGTAVPGQISFSINIASTCTYRLTPTPGKPTTYGLEGGSGQIDFSTANGCPIDVKSSQSWLKIQGTPQGAVGRFGYTVDPATDARTGAISLGDQSVAIEQVIMPLSFRMNDEMGPFSLGTSFHTDINVAGGKPPYTYDVQGLPAGMYVLTGKNRPCCYQDQDNSAVLFGTPVSAGDFPISVTVTDSANSTPLTHTFNLHISPIFLPNSILPDAYTGRDYQYTLPLAGYTGTLKVTLQTNPPGGDRTPAWLKVNSATGELYGTPTTADGLGTFNPWVMVEDDATNHRVFFRLRLQLNRVRIENPGLLVMAGTNLPYATRGSSAEVDLTGTQDGQPAKFSWGFTGWGMLPNGMNLDQATGIISGTPSQSGQFRSQITASNGDLNNWKPFTFVVVPPTPDKLQISTADLPDTSVGEYILSQFSASGGLPPYKWSLASGSLPPGMVFEDLSAKTPVESLDAVLRGSTPQAGTYTFTLTVQDSSPTPQTASQTFSLLVSPVMAVRPFDQMQAVLGKAFETYLTQAGGKPPYSFKIVNGSLPAGVQFDEATGRIWGQPLDTGYFSFWVRIADSGTGTAQNVMVRRSYSLYVHSTSNPSDYTVEFGNEPNLGNFPSGSTSSWNLSPFGSGVAPYTFSVTDPSKLPPGLTLSPGDRNLSAILSGIPTTPGTYTFQIVATDSNGLVGARTFTVHISALRRADFGGSLRASVGQPYLSLGTASGGTGPYTWSLSGGSLPQGVTISSDGRLTGTPTQAGTFQFSTHVVDRNGEWLDISWRWLTVAPFSIGGNTVLDSWQPGVPQSAPKLPISGNPNGTVTFSFAGPMVSGLTISPDGVISGTPAGPQTLDLAIQAQDSAQNTSTRHFSLTVLPPSGPTPISVAGADKTIYFTAGMFGAQPLTVQGGVPPYTVQVTSGQLPAGLQVGYLPDDYGKAGVWYVSGTPTTPATATDIELTITDAATTTFKQPVKIAVSKLMLDPPQLNWATFNQPYTFSFAATGGTGKYTFSVVSGAWPQGVSMTSAGAVSGAPLRTGFGSVRIRVEDEAGNAYEREYPVQVNLPNEGTQQPGLGFSTGARLNDASVGIVYQQPIYASWTGGQPVFKPVGELPAGLQLANTGWWPSPSGPQASATVYGVPSAAGTYNITLEITDPTMPSVAVRRTFVLVVSPLAQLAPWPPTAYNGESYSYQLPAPAGATGSVAWRPAFGAYLPSGWSLSPTGVLSGQANGMSPNFDAEVQVGGVTLTQHVNVAISSLHVTSGPELPAAVNGVAYSQTLAVTGGTAPYSWSRSGGVLPPGLTLSSTGVLSGSLNLPSGAISFRFDVQVTDSKNNKGTASLVVAGLSDAANRLTIPDQPIQTLSVGNPLWNVSLNAVGGTSPYTWRVASGSLPEGVSLASAPVPGFSQWAAVLQGTPLKAGTSTVTFEVKDSANAVATATYQIVVSPLYALNWNSSTPVMGSQYSIQYGAAGGTPPYTFAVNDGDLLPAGLTLSGNTISGKPAETGSFQFSLKVSDSAGNSYLAKTYLTIQPDGKPLVEISTPKSLTATVGVPISISLSPSGATTWALAAGSQLPAGLTLDGNVLSGVIDQANVYQFALQATNGSAIGVRVFRLEVTSVGIASAMFNQGSVGKVYRGKLYPTGGKAPFTWTVPDGSKLPPGLNLLADGTVEGTPTDPGSFPFSIQLTDAAGQKATLKGSLNFSPIRVTTKGDMPNGAVNQPYAPVQFTAEGGNPPYTWTFAGGAGPAGLTLSRDGVLSGTPVNFGSTYFDVEVDDTAGHTVIESFGLYVFEAPPAALHMTERSSFGDYAAGTLVTDAYYALGGMPPYSFSLAAGTLPVGMEVIASDKLPTNFNSGIGWLSGVPRVPGDYTFTLRVTDSAGATATRQYTLHVSPMRIVKNAGAFQWTQTHQPQNPQQWVVAGGKGPYTWTRVEAAGTLPAGLQMSPSGVFSGIPLETGVFPNVFVITDQNGQTLTRRLNVVVNTPKGTIDPRLPLEFPPVQAGQSFQYPVTPRGGTAPYQMSLASEPGFEPPAGAGIFLTDTQKGVGGTVTTPGRYPILVRVDDNNGNTGIRAVTLVISPLKVQTATLPDAVFGAPYTTALTVGGGTAPYKWELAPGAVLPQGLNLDGAGVLAGTPRLVGSYTIPMIVSDAAKNSITQSIQISVIAIPSSGCAYQVSTFDPLPAAGGQITFKVTPNAALCDWKAAPDSATTFAGITSGGSGPGEGTVTVSVAPNTATVERNAVLLLTGTSLATAQQVKIRQYGAEEVCHFVSKPGSLDLASGAAATILDVHPSAEKCQVKATSDSAWLSVTKITDNRYVELSVAANTGEQRSASLTIGDIVVPVTQQKPCLISLNPATGNIVSGGGVQTFAVTTNGCSYSATSDSSWITVVNSGATGTVTYSVAPNSSTAARSSTIRVGDQTFNLSQGGASCKFSLRAGPRTFGNGGGSSTITVTLDPGTNDTTGACTWAATAASNDNWLSIAPKPDGTDGSAGVDSGSVDFIVPPNPTIEQREGTLTVAGQQLRVVQAGLSCTYALRGSSASMPFQGGSDSVEAVMPQGCSVTSVTNDAAWLAVTVSGSAIKFDAQKNETPFPRLATLTVQGIVFTVAQAGAPCVYTVDESALSATAAGTTAAIHYHALLANGCGAPEVRSFDSFVHVSAAAGGAVAVQIEPNGAPVQRSGTVSVGGRTITVNQEAASCSYEISPFSKTFFRAGGDDKFSLVAAPAACGAPAPADPPSWISLTGTPPLTPQDTGLWWIPFHVDPFPAATRTTRRGFITVGGRSFVIRQFSR